jgi:hypothetical protein
VLDEPAVLVAVLLGILGGGAVGAALADWLGEAAAGAIPGLPGAVAAGVPQEATPL